MGKGCASTIVIALILLAAEGAILLWRWQPWALVEVIAEIIVILWLIGRKESH